MHTQLYKYNSDNKLLCEQQYGFQSQHLTGLAAIKLVDYLTHNMDTNTIPISIYLDPSKAFDTLLFDIRNINSIRRYLCEDSTKLLVNSTVLSRLDYCNSIYVGLPQTSLHKLQLAQKTVQRE